MCGGNSQLRNIDKAIRKEIDVPVRIAEDPLTCVARGTGLVIENLDKFKDALESEDEVMG
jgi:rod shape-determining protein MreB